MAVFPKVSDTGIADLLILLRIPQQGFHKAAVFTAVEPEKIKKRDFHIGGKIIKAGEDRIIKLPVVPGKLQQPVGE